MQESQPQPTESSLCEPCMSIFQRNLELTLKSSDKSWPPPVHHHSAASFEDAVAAGCVICRRALVAMQKDHREDLITKTRTNTFSRYSLTESPSGPPDYQVSFYIFEPDDLHLLTRKAWYTFDQTVVSLTRYDGPTVRRLTDHGTSTASNSAWDQVLGWYHDCCENHASCNARRETSYLPSRVLDISGNSDIRLVVTDAKTTNGEYATLSHCWGNSDILTLRQDNMTLFQDKIPLESLPRTFQEAIQVARKLGLPYLWIDSLCIVQDSRPDWQHESALMDKVYSNSMLNIMATASNDSSQGLFRDRDPLEFDHCIVRSSWDDSDPKEFCLLNKGLWDSLVKSAPLNQRGWVLQERILAPRALHFAYNQLAWECHEKDACEMYPDKLPGIVENLHNRVKIIEADAYQSWIRTWREYDPLHPVGYDVWVRIVKLYGGTRLSKPSDKLVALSGLAKRMRTDLKDRYLAGLWESRLAYELVWFPIKLRGHNRRARRPKAYRAPSWSWASITGDVMMVMMEKMMQPILHIEIEEASVTPLSPLDDTGEVVDGHIRLRGTLLKAELVEKEHSFSREFWVGGKRSNGNPLLDEPLEVKNHSVVYLPVLWEKTDTFGEMIHGIILVPVEGKPQGWYSRVGVHNTWPRKEKDEAWDHIIARLNQGTFNDDSLCLEEAPRSIMFV